MISPGLPNGLMLDSSGLSEGFLSVAVVPEPIPEDFTLTATFTLPTSFSFPMPLEPLLARQVFQSLQA